jgi:hypothetical protein
MWLNCWNCRQTGKLSTYPLVQGLSSAVSPFAVEVMLAQAALVGMYIVQPEGDL